MLKILTTAAVSLSVLAGSALGQTNPIPSEKWGVVQDYLERNPKVFEQLEQMIDAEIKPNQAALDAAYIAENEAKIFSDPNSPVLGNPNGKITVVKFSDYNCIHCKNVTPELEKLIASDPEVKVIIKEFPVLGPDSVEAAKFALAAKLIGGNAAFKKVEKALFENEARITGYLLEDIASEAGLDARKTIQAMDAKEVIDQLNVNLQLAHDLKIKGTPGLIIGDRVVRGGIPFEVMKQGISEEYPEHSVK